MLLSIGMIVKNEEKFLRDCLNGIKPILEEIHSELIIYDTGSSDSTVEIAKEFTSKVYQTAWRGDFAWARNHTVDKAVGKWYMFLDADEIFTDVTDIIDFFKTEEYKKYNTATYRLDNITPNGARGFFRPVRLFKLKKDTRFVGKIHEYIPPYLPVKNLDSVADHHGYNLGSSRRKEKNKRNLKPLLEEHEENPNDVRTIVHIINEYGSMGDDEERERYINLGLSLVADETERTYYHVLKSKQLEQYITDGKHEEIIELVNTYLDSIDKLELNAVQMKISEANALVSLERYAEAAKAYERSLEFFEMHQKGQIDESLSFHYILNTSILTDRKIHQSRIISSYAQAGNFDTALKWLEDSPSVGISKINVFRFYIQNCIKNENWDEIIKVYEYALNSPDIYNNAVTAIEQSINSVKTKEKIGKVILDNFSGKDEDYVRLQSLRQSYRLQDEGFLQRMEYFLNSGKPYNQEYVDVWLMAMEYAKDHSLFIQKLRVVNGPEVFSSLIKSNENVQEILLAYLNKSANDDFSVKELSMLSSLAAVVYAKFKTEDDEDKKIELFEASMRIRHRYLAGVYKEDVYNADNVIMLPEQDSFTFFVGSALVSRDSNDTAGYASNLKHALRANPAMKGIIKLLTGKLVDQESAAPTNVQEQLSKEVAALKSIIYTMINTGNLKQAAQILESYAEANPSDPEIEKLRAMIGANAL